MTTKNGVFCVVYECPYTGALLLLNDGDSMLNKNALICDACQLKIAPYEHQVHENAKSYHEDCNRKRVRMQGFIEALMATPKLTIVVPKSLLRR